MTGNMDACIYDGGRSAFGRQGGALASVRPDDLLAHIIRSVVGRNPFPGTAYEDVIMGNTNHWHGYIGKRHRHCFRDFP